MREITYTDTQMIKQTPDNDNDSNVNQIHIQNEYQREGQNMIKTNSGNNHKTQTMTPI